MQKRLIEIDEELHQIEERSEEIHTAVETAEHDELEKLSAEITEMEERKAALLAEKAELEAKEEEARSFDESKATEIELPKAAMPEQEERKMFDINTVEYRNAWVKRLIGREMNEEERAALGAAGAVIPTMTVNAVWDKLVKPAELLGRVDVSQFPTYVRFPKAVTNGAATAQAVGGTISESSDVINYVDLIPNEYVKLLTVGADIDHMAVEAVHDWIVENLTGKIREAINDDILAGSGTNSLKGIAASVTADSTALPATLTIKALLKVMGKLDGNYQNGAVWIMTPALFYEEVMGLADIKNYVLNDGFQFKLFGHDVILMSGAEVESKENIFYGDPKAYKVNIFKALEIKPFETANTTNIQFRGATMADGELIDNAAFVRFAKA
jgi:HK97 family phage major capsid protein